MKHLLNKRVLDTDGSFCRVINVDHFDKTNKYEKTICVFIKKKTDKGIDVNIWFTEHEFNSRFFLYDD